MERRLIDMFSDFKKGFMMTCGACVATWAIGFIVGVFKGAAAATKDETEKSDYQREI